MATEMAASSKNPDVMVFVSMLVVLSATISWPTCVSIDSVNLALKQPAFMSSAETKWGSRPAELASDGKLKRGNRNCFQTKEQENPWWAVDLGKVADVDRVVILNRKYKSDKFGNFVVFVSMVAPAYFQYEPDHPGLHVCFHHGGMVDPDERVVIVCTKPTRGRYLYVLQFRHDHLRLCEVQVFAARNTHPTTNAAAKNVLTLLSQCPAAPRPIGKVLQLIRSNVTREVMIVFGPEVVHCPAPFIAVGSAMCYLISSFGALGDAVDTSCTYTCEISGQDLCNRPGGTQVKVGHFHGTYFVDTKKCNSIWRHCLSFSTTPTTTPTTNNDVLNTTTTTNNDVLNTTTTTNNDVLNTTTTTTTTTATTTTPYRPPIDIPFYVGV